ncbi:metalloregulator ArsR/SmtB family transcription factor [Microbacterium sp. Sa4CUA7]|uniref:Metalloregulator ArsR/SmtB family transcription factor n=1 Tax=Microbacterium pullorum TaxID=2762236 RepID=A0ABR8RYQ8_9MICO|nr:metalloregulator ArsR/SmtB family transcription factor [Microbacterium pullorum]MBD7956357.1 metalloregulator ArsR/SmtB family transcription factor [Microbacterium pullorum]
MTTARAVVDADACTPAPARAISLDAATTIAGVLKALADPLRLRILSTIATDPRGESCVCDFAALSDVSQPTISHHLKVLKETGLLLSERRGTWVWYRVDPARSGAVTALLDTLAPAAFNDTTPRDEALSSARLRGMDGRVTRLAEELADEHPQLDRHLVTTIVRESYTSLSRTARVTNMLIPITERFSRQRLADMSRDRSAGAPHVLFVCVQNAGRSQLAAALLTQRSGGAVVARSAGSTPAADVHPNVRSLLAQIGGGDLADAAFPKPLTDDAVRAADVVVTMGCGDVCPIIPGVRYEDWAVADPALASEAGVAVIRDDITARVDALLATLTPSR